MNCPLTPGQKNRGIKTANVVAADAVTGQNILFAA